jgi:hypothetical protein
MWWKNMFKPKTVMPNGTPNATFFPKVRKSLFSGSLSQKQVDGLNLLLEATRGLAIQHRAYILATAYHETGQTMQPVRETNASTDARAVAILDSAFKKGQLTWVRTPYWHFDSSGKTWLGRGYVQLTHKANYIKASQELKVDLLTDPNKAMDPAVAANILVRGSMEGWFTGVGLYDFDNYKDMRRVINGTERASTVAEYAKQFEKALNDKEDV